MARIDNKLLFFTTSPRTPAKMIPEIKLLSEKFSGKSWNKLTQEAFINELAHSDFFEGKGSPFDKAFSARDRINRAPKALGFIDLNPCVALTEAGNFFIYGKRPQEIFLRQLLKFQLPSPYHSENKNIIGTSLPLVKPWFAFSRRIPRFFCISGTPGGHTFVSWATRCRSRATRRAGGLRPPKAARLFPPAKLPSPSASKKSFSMPK